VSGIIERVFGSTNLFVDALLEENRLLRGALEKVEWVPDASGWIVCAWCDNFQEHWHKPDCVRQAALGDKGEEEK
jgi:hypothetical protein